jgi:hypothetical protein
MQGADAMFLNMSAWAWTDWMGNLGYLILLVSYFTTDAMRLRLLAAIGLPVLAVVAYVGGMHPPWLAAMWLLLLSTINAFRLIVRSPDGGKKSLTIEEEALRLWLFPTMSHADFVNLLKAGKRSVVGSGTFLATQGEKIDKLHFITQGAAHVITNGMVVATLREGSLVGEVSFFRDDVATASVVAQGDIKVLSFGREQLRKLMKSRETLHRALHESIGRDLGFKLTQFDESRF